MRVRHATQTAAADSGNGKISANAWNEDHDLTGTANTVLGFDASGNATELTASNNMFVDSGVFGPSLSGTDTILGRSSAGGGAAEEITCTAAGRALLDDADAAAQRTTLGLGTAATDNEATTAEIRAATASKLVPADKLQAAAAFITLTPGATISWDVSTGFNAKCTLGSAANAFSAPTNPKEGVTYTLQLIQDATGGRTATYDASFDFGGAGTPTLSTTAAKIDLITLMCLNATTPVFRAVFSRGE